MLPGPLKFIVTGTQDPALTRRQLDAAKLAGINARELYCIVYGDGDNGRRLDEAQAISDEQGKLGIWLDLEETETGIDATNAPEITRSCTAHLDAWGGPWGVYSSAGFWQSCMEGQSATLAPGPRRLWVASWLPHREPTPADFKGWGTEWTAFGDGYLYAPDTWQYDHDIQLPTPFGSVLCDFDARYDFASGQIVYGIDVSNWSGYLNPDALRWLADPANYPVAPDAPGDSPPAPPELPVNEPPPTRTMAPAWLAGGIMPDGLPHGIVMNGAQLQVYNGPGKPVLVIGDVEGDFPGRFAKLFGDDYVWLRRNGPDAFWGPEGD